MHLISAKKWGLCCLALGMPAIALAQSDPPPNDHLQEVIVTAERKGENLDKVPIAITALSGSELRQRDVNSLDQLQFQVPSLSVQQEGFLQFVNIRGIGLQAVNPSTSSGVAFYTDGFFIPHETAIGEAYMDLAQVEVLRGPQGTLVGQNSTGGAIFLVSQKPALGAVNGYVNQTIGNFGDYSTDGAANVPLGSKVALRVAARQETRDSFYHVLPQPGLGVYSSTSQPGNVHSHAVRLSLLYSPFDNLQVTVRQEIESNHTDGIAARAYAELQNPSTPVLANPWNLQYNLPTKNDYNLQRTIATVDWQITDAVKLRSVSGYQHESSRLIYDLDYSAVPNSFGYHHFWENTVEQEIDLLSAGTHRLNWVAGLFYMDDSLPVEEQLSIGQPAISEVEFSYPVHASYSVFGQLTYDLSRNWQIIAGGRISHDRITDRAIASVGSAVRSIDGLEASTQPTGKVSLNWFATSNTMVYASVSKGYKAGGLNATTGNPTFAPETLIDYEVGIKAKLAHDHMRVTGAVFDYDDKNYQLQVYNPSIRRSAITNAGTAKLYGAEVAIDARVGGLEANVSTGYTHSSVGNLFLEDPRVAALGVQNLNGRPMDYAPKITLAGGIQYAAALAAGTITPRVQYTYTGEQYASPFELAPYDLIRSHGQLGASVTYQSGRWWLSIYGSNLTDKLYVDGIVRAIAAAWGNPRQYGIKGGVRF